MNYSYCCLGLKTATDMVQPFDFFPMKQIVTDFGLYVRWDGDNRVEVRLQAGFKNKTCGLCGNYNGDGSKEDEFRTPDGIFVSRANIAKGVFQQRSLLSVLN